MGYRIHFLGFSSLPKGKLESSLRKRGSFEDEFFSNPEVFVSNESWSAISVSKRSGICDHFEDIIAELATPSIWITTNDVDDWQVRIHDGTGKWARLLYLPWVNVDPDEHQEEDGAEVLDSIKANELPQDLKEKLASLETGDAWQAFFDYAHAELKQSLEKASIPFDAKGLLRMFSEEDFGDVSEYEAAQLGYFINAVLGVGFDLSAADE